MPFVISDIFGPNARQLRSKCSVIDPVTGNSCQASAIWDTGASCSCISPELAKKLSLPIVGSTTSHTANGSTPSNRHVVDIAIGNVRFQKIAVSALPLPEDLVLIGMDLIGLGRFTVQNANVDGEQRKILTLEIA
jgi:predicted aspartyl protease